MKKKAKTFDELAPKRRKFIDLYIKYGDHIQAHIDAGFNSSDRTRAMHARRLRMDLEPFITERVEQKIGSGAVRAFNVIEDLMMKAKSEQVKLAAAKDLLSRAGYDKPQEILHKNIVEEMPKDQLLSEIERLTQKLTKDMPVEGTDKREH